MCGIAGWIGHVHEAPALTDRLIKRLRHRGPDGQGSHLWEDAGLVHTRLSIIDLSEAGLQPMANEDQSVWCIANCEIYNHRALRGELERQGHRFHGHCDVEIIPHLYEELGMGFVEQLRGMFAIALVDRRKGSLLLARDRFGIKPLFHALTPHYAAFASELGALKEFPEIDLSPDPQAVADYAALFAIPAPGTFYKGIRALEPGKILRCSLDETGTPRIDAIRRYHGWTIAPDPSLIYEDALEKTEELIRAGVARQLESDVPLGALLSGGIDSSLVSAFAQQSLREPMRTFNVQFPEKSYDETWAARAVSRHIGSAHRTLPLDAIPGSWEQITGLLRCVGQPYADTSLFPAAAICRLTRRHVTVALSGDGGDEGFGGYAFHWKMARIARLQTLPGWAIRTGLFGMTTLARAGLAPGTFPTRLHELASADDVSIIETFFSWIRPREFKQLVLPNDFLPPRRLFEPQWSCKWDSATPRAQRLSDMATEANVRLVLANDFLFKTDIAGMRVGLEVRVPMLDEDLFGFALTLPLGLKIRGRTCKRLLRGVAARHLPRPVVEKPKQGFSIPMDTWVDAEFKARVRSVLLSASNPLNDFFDPRCYAPWVDAFARGKRVPDISRVGLYQRVIMLLSLWLTLTDNRETV